jgi:hypothetical protein
MPKKLPHWRYDPNWQTRLVKGKGMIDLAGQGRFVGEAFEGHGIGLKPSRAGVREVHFGPLLIGELWDRKTTGIRATWYRKGRRGKLAAHAFRLAALFRLATLASTPPRSGLFFPHCHPYGEEPPMDAPLKKNSLAKRAALPIY